MPATTLYRVACSNWTVGFGWMIPVPTEPTVEQTITMQRDWYTTLDRTNFSVDWVSTLLPDMLPVVTPYWSSAVSEAYDYKSYIQQGMTGRHCPIATWGLWTCGSPLNDWHGFQNEEDYLAYERWSNQ